ncbi:MAG TPA: mechanosensitive ion channel domain-containing protein [Rubrivivax sp.]|nr:mechanosensitive ion channel domain-containing protein [Rubrivivax sp.]
MTPLTRSPYSPRGPWRWPSLFGLLCKTAFICAVVAHGPAAPAQPSMSNDARPAAAAAPLAPLPAASAALISPEPGAARAPNSPATTATDAGADALPETADVTAQDASLVRQLLARFSRIDGLRDVAVDIHAGIATLSGEVATEEHRQRAGALAKELPGVVEVDNRLRLDTSLTVRLGPAVARATALAQQVVEAIPLIALAVLLVWLVSALGRWLGERQVLHRLVGHQPFLVAVLRQTVRVGAVLLGLVVALDLLEATALVQAVVGTAGIVGLAVGFALRDVVENYIAGLLLSLRQPFALNDHVVIEGHEGNVASLTTRATSLITPDGNHLRLPNSLVFKGVILNYTRNPLRRFSFRLGVGVGENLHQTRCIGIDTLAALRGVLPHPPPAGAVVELAHSSVTMEFSGWFDQRETGFLRLRSDAITAVKAALDTKGIDLPDPTYRVQMLSQPDADGASDSPAVLVPQAARSLADLPERSAVADDPLSDERAVERQVTEEHSRTGGSNLLKSSAPRE